jgi:hypothetical protein
MYSCRCITLHSNNEQRKKKGALSLDTLVIGKEEDVHWYCIADMIFEDYLRRNQVLMFINKENLGDQVSHGMREHLQ